MAPGPGHDFGPFVRNVVQTKSIINIKSNINPVTGSVNDVIGGISLNLMDSRDTHNQFLDGTSSGV